jgi:Bacterial archaeo-eukaryotic release factor family 10
MATTWESIEEREQRVRGTRTSSVMARAAEQIPEGKTLNAAFAERPFISREDLRSIARQHYERPVITLYLNFNPQTLLRSDPPVLVSVFHSLRHQALETRKPYIEALPRAQRLALPDELGEVQAFLEGYRPAGAQSIVILKSGDQLNRVMPLPVRVADSLTIDADPFIEPLEAILEEQRRVLVVDLSKEKTSFSIYDFGFEERVHAITSSVPSDEVEPSPKDRVQRHRLTHLQWHFKASARAADRLFRERGCDRLALIGEATLVREFEDYLAKSLRDRLIGELHLSPDDGPNQRHAVLREALAKQRKIEEEATLNELGFFAGHGRLAAGLEKVIDAANLFLMRSLILDNELARPGYVCRNHHFLSLTAGSCPFDGEALLPAENVVDELVEMARLHGVEVMLVTSRQELLAPYGGAAAVLVTAAPVEELRTVNATS